MQRLKVTEKSQATLLSGYPHTPDNEVLSFEEYLEEELAAGWEVASFSYFGSSWFTVFRASGRNS